MIHLMPTRDQFTRLTGQADAVPVYCSLLSDRLTPVSAFERLAGESESAFLLESVVGGEKIARYSFLGTDPVCRIEADDRGTTVTTPQGSVFHGHADPLIVRQYLRSYSMGSLGTEDVYRREGMAAFVAGWDRSPKTEQLFRVGLDQYPLRGVCISLRRPARVREALRQARFRREVAGEEYEIWLRADPSEKSAVRSPSDGP